MKKHNIGHKLIFVTAEFDDAKVTEIKEEAIVPLEGGGEGPIAYLLLYKAKPLK